MKGRYKITTLEKGRVVHQTDWIKNLVMVGPLNGVGLITEHLFGNTTYPLEITSASIGTGSTAPAVTDTALVAQVLADIPVRTKSKTTTMLSFSFFIPNIDLPNGTYREFGLWSGTRLFARSLILPVYTKATGQDAIITDEVTAD